MDSASCWVVCGAPLRSPGAALHARAAAHHALPAAAAPYGLGTCKLPGPGERGLEAPTRRHACLPALPRIPSVRCMSADGLGLRLEIQPWRLPCPYPTPNPIQPRPQARTAQVRARRPARRPQPEPTPRRRPLGGRPPPPRPRAPRPAAPRPPTPARRSARRAGGPRARRRPPRPRLRAGDRFEQGSTAQGPLCCSETRPVNAAGALQTASTHDAPSAMNSRGSIGRLGQRSDRYSAAVAAAGAPSAWPVQGCARRPAGRGPRRRRSPVPGTARRSAQGPRTGHQAEVRHGDVGQLPAERGAQLGQRAGDGVPRAPRQRHRRRQRVRVLGAAARKHALRPRAAACAAKLG